ncbi:MAG: hypothetical protein ABII18_09130 [bacterium]|nr:hypothetical protein [bacterium]MBU1918622.1 hypothetical protein [bacterium]
MYRTSRHINKNDGLHNLFGEEDSIVDAKGYVHLESEELEIKKEEPQQNEDLEN